MTAPIERLNALDTVEKEIISCLQSAGQVLQEMGKDKPSQKQVDLHSQHFLKTLNQVEIELSQHINYLTQVSTGQAHEGSSYAAQKTLQMAWHRSEHARSKVKDLDISKNQVLAAARQSLQASTTPATTATAPARSGGSLPPTPSAQGQGAS